MAYAPCVAPPFVTKPVAADDGAGSVIKVGEGIKEGGASGGCSNGAMGCIAVGEDEEE